MDFETLTRAQINVLAEAVQRSVGRRSRFDDIMDEAGLDLVEDMVESDGFRQQLPRYMREMQRRSKLGAVVEAIRASEYGQAPELKTIDTRVALALPFGGAEASVAPSPTFGAPAQPTGLRSEPPALNLERAIETSDLSNPYDWTDKLLNWGRSMCRIKYSAGLAKVNGTGIALPDGRVLTNYHVIEPILQGAALPSAVRCIFGFAEIDGDLQIGPQVSLAENWLGPHAPPAPFDLGQSEELPGAGHLDYAILRLENAVPDVPVLNLPGSADAHDPGDIVFVLQHPQGETLQHAPGLVTDSPSPRRLRYTATTKSGSSGGLVLNAKLEPVALHHAGDPDFEDLAAFNQGIPLGLIGDALAAA